MSREWRECWWLGSAFSGCFKLVSSVTLEYPKFYDRYDVFIICPSTGCGSSMEEPGRAVFLATPIGAGLYTSIDF